MNAFKKVRQERAMPKIIKDVREKIIRESSEIIKRGESERFSARQIAERCSIAVGTLYNYFPSIEALLVTLIGDEWKRTVEEIDEKCATASTVSEGLDYMLRGLRGFTDKYYSFWISAVVAGGSVKLGGSFHSRLREEISERIEKLFTKCGHKYDKKLMPAVAEIIISLGAGQDVEPESAFDLVRAVADKCCGK